MTEDDFRRLALQLPEAVESAHMGHPDFRVRGRIFATLGPAGEGWGMVKLTREQQPEFVRERPAVFEPISGGWGRNGATRVRLASTTKPAAVRPALLAAWRNTAPKRLVEKFAGA